MNGEVKLNVSQSRGYENASLELVKIKTNEQGQKLVSGRELHEVLEIGVHFSTWMKRMCEYGFQENIDFSILKSGNPNGGIAKVDDYAITLDMAKHIAMVQRTEIGMKVRNYFIECEKAAHNPYSHLSKEFQALIMHDEKIMKLERRVEDIEDNAYLSPSEYGMVGQKVNNKIHAIVVERGLKLSRQQRSELYKSLNRDIKTITGVHHRCQLRRKHLDQVLEFIYRWEPSLATMMKVEQMSLFNNAS